MACIIASSGRLAMNGGRFQLARNTTTSTNPSHRRFSSSTPVSTPTSSEFFVHGRRRAFASGSTFTEASTVGGDNAYQQSHHQSGQWTKASYFASAAALASIATLGFMTTAATSTTSDTVAAIKRRTTGGGPGGGGPRRKPTGYSSFLTSRRRAEEELRTLTEDASSKPYTVSIGAVQGERRHMEDEYKVAGGGRFAAVFDGHGGNDVSVYLRNRLYDTYTRMLLRKFWEERDDDDHETDGTKTSAEQRPAHAPSIASMVAALREAIEQVEKEVVGDKRMNFQGSTAVAVVLHTSKDGGERTLLAANVGDSRAILSRGGRAMELTVDHKPNQERERARILTRGGEVEWDSYAQVHRVQNLSLSRAIGDSFAKPIVGSDPDIRHFPVVEGEDEFILLASDGLWDVMTSQEVVDFVRNKMNKTADGYDAKSAEHTTFSAVQRKTMAKNVAMEALRRGTSDNVCVVLVWLD